MKKICINTFIIIIIIILKSQNSFCQVSKVEYYTFTKNTIDTTGIRTYLLFNKNKSLFVWKSIVNKIENSKNSLDKGNTDMSFKKIINDTIGTQVFNLYSDTKLILREPLLENNFTVIDNKIIIDWKLSDEIKTIVGIDCQKATTIFRGRKYIAWFTYQIPIPTGPWKLNGLPGLIIEAYDEKREVNFLFKRLIKNVTKVEKIEVIVDENTISIKEFVRKKDNIHNEIINQALSKLPRGVSIKSTHTNKRKGMELIFEWEKQ